MSALETLLRPVADLVNRQIRMKTPARALCDELAGRVVAVRLRHTSLSLRCRVEADGIRLTGDDDGTPDAVITGSLLALARLSARSGEEAVRSGALDLDGDADVARMFQRLMQYGRPDLEEELSGVVGDSAAHALGQFSRSFRDWGRQARSTMRQNLGEYLQEESRAVPGRHEAEAFRREVETLRDDVDRLEARLRQLESASRSDPDES
jgi:ubiquinone biosynthesis accessory factor UbiJ